MVVGELVGLDEVRRPDLGALLAERRGDRIHGPLHHEAALRAPGPAVRRDHHRVRVEAVEGHPVGTRLVGTEQLGGGDDRHDQPVRRVGAGVVPEAHVEPEDASLVVVPDVDVVDLPTLVRGRDEVLAPVLGELHDPVEGAGRVRHQQLLRPRVVDLDAEAAADVGRDHVDLSQVEARAWRRPPPARRSRSGSRSTPSAARCRGPSVRPCPAPPSAWRRSARW